MFRIEKINDAIHHQHIAGAEVHPQFGQIGSTPNPAGVLAVRQLINHIQVVVAYMRKQEPCLVALDGTGERRARRPVVEVKSLHELEGGKKICGIKMKLVVAVIGLKSSKSG